MTETRRVAVAMAATPRAAYLTSGQRRYADDDIPLPLFNNQTNSQPSTVVTMLRLLDVPEGARVLDVGAGSGWTTAILAHLVGPAGSVLGVERDVELAGWGAANVTASGRTWARVKPARPGVLGAPEAGPFDRILVSAMAPVIPLQLVEQLMPGGIMVIPVDGRMVRVIREEAPGSKFRTRRFGYYRFVPLIID